MFNSKQKKLDKKMTDWIIKSLEKGKSKEAIIASAVKVGWNEDKLNEIFMSIEAIHTFDNKPELPKIEESKNKSINMKLDEVSSKLDTLSGTQKEQKKVKKKSFKLPGKVKRRLKKLAEQSKVQVLLLQRTRNISPVIGELRDGMLFIGDNVYEGAIKYTWTWMCKYPTMIVPEWDLKPLTPEGITKMRRPISPTELFNDTLRNHRSAEPQKIIIRAMELKAAEIKKKIGGGMLLWILIGGAIIFGLFFMSKKG